MSQEYMQVPRASSVSDAPLAAEASAPLPGERSVLHSEPIYDGTTNDLSPSTSSSSSQAQRIEKEKEVADHERIYAENRGHLITAIDSTSDILEQLRAFNRDRWVVHYPHGEAATNDNAPTGTLRRSQTAQDSLANHPGLQRASTSIDASSDSAQSAPSTPRKALTRTQTTVDGEADRATDEAEHRAPSAQGMSVLKLDLKLGVAGHNPSSLVRALEKSSVAQLLESRMASSLRQLGSLRQRLGDTQSKVLVTGDLNAGKSTFVNALLRRRVMPTDQQPCTTVFCEVLDAAELNDGVEELHVLRPGLTYDRANDDTFVRHALSDLEQIVADAEDVSAEDAPMIKCYCADTRATQESLLRNGVVDIALIDAPGLNRDSLKTTALFARQDEIDVVVFVVSAENHFTLSAKEFLWNASNDKAYVFIVVNKYDQIRNKDKCRRLVLEQIRQLSPRTYADADNLVHFVDSSAVAVPGVDTATADDEEPGESITAFARLEAALRDFVLLRRSKSKLMPAQTYLLRLLSDVDMLARTNTSVAGRELEEARGELAVARPALEQCKAAHMRVEGELEGEEDEVVARIIAAAKSRLDAAVDSIAEGQCADASVALPEYPGLLSIWEYARDVRAALAASLEASLRKAEDEARERTAVATRRIKEIGEAALPPDAEPGSREFLSEQMFLKRRAASAASVGLGFGAELVEVKITDLFDAKHHLLVLTGARDSSGDDLKGEKALKRRDDNEELSYVNGFGLGLALILGGKTMGARTAIEAFMRVTSLAQSRWAKPIAVVVVAGATYWFVTELPHQVCRNVGRDQARTLRRRDEQRPDFATAHSARLGRGSRRVVRMMGWDVNERFRSALARRRADVEREEAKERSAEEALAWFAATHKRALEVRDGVAGLEGWD